ncbi:MAG: effector-associated domain EAD1-containing protein [Caldilineaceae bacterium]
MKLTGHQIQTLQSTLLSAYGSPAALAQMVRIYLDQNLNTVAGGDNLGEIVFNLIAWAERSGNLLRLAEGAAEANPGNAAVQNWLEENRELLAKLDADVGVEMSKVDKPWWEQIDGVSNMIAGLDLSNVKGNVVIGNVGSGSRNVAIGEGITQIITEVLGEAQPDDRAQIDARFAQIVAALNQSAVEPRTAGKAEARLEDLQSELTQADKPDADEITKMGDWLLENVPQITQALSELFGMPAVGRVLAKAGGAAVEWTRQKFGNGR